MIIFDLDGVLANWDKDEPIQPVFEILDHLFRNEYDFQIWSGRCESVRDKTVHFLCKHSPAYNVLYMHNPSLILLKMRQIGDNTTDDVLKEQWLNDVLAQGKIIEFVFDSDPASIAMWRRRKVFVFDCAQSHGEF